MGVMSKSGVGDEMLLVAIEHRHREGENWRIPPVFW